LPPRCQSKSTNRIQASRLVKQNRKTFSRFLRRLGRNLKHNRLFILYGGRIFLASQKLTGSISEDVKRAANLSESPSTTVYRALFTRGAHFGALSHRAVFHSHLGRFGNAVTEIVGSIELAQITNSGFVILEGHNVFAKSGDIPSDGQHSLSSGRELWIDCAVAPQSVRELVHIKGAGRMLGAIDCTSSWVQSRDFVRLQASEPVPDSTLTIHLRGGDVFGNRDVSHYGQPPFAFYLRVLEEHKWRHVEIVSQDNLNPTLELITQHCETNDIPFRWEQRSLKKDLETLLAAKTIVASRGTFIPAVVGLSNNIETVYFFEDKFVMQPPMSGVKQIRIWDAKGEFRKSLLQGNWANTDSQRYLMATYPAKFLRIERASDS